MKKQKGYVAILTVLILMSVIITAATTVTLLSIGEAQSALALYKGEDTLAFVEGCAEDALLKSRASASYTGGPITRPEGTCSVTINKAGTTWTITVSTTNTLYVRTIQIVINRLPTGITLTSWKEI